jgi:hypothetical protein
LEFLKASIADLVTLLFSSLQNLKAVATATAVIILLTPANFYHFRRPKFSFQPLSFTFETFGKKLAETKIVARVNVRKIKAKKIENNAFKWPAMKWQPVFTKICQRQKSAFFWPPLRLCCNVMSKYIFLMSCLDMFRSI